MSKSYFITVLELNANLLRDGHADAAAALLDLVTEHVTGTEISTVAMLKILNGLRTAHPITAEYIEA